MTEKFTTLIIGGGPAGSAAAYTLAKLGVDVCIVDKAVFPREKLCGGLLTSRSRKIFDKVFGGEWDKAWNYQSKGVHFCTRDGYLNGTETSYEWSFTHRISFDDYLLGMAREAGTIILQGERVEDLDINSNTCILRSGKILHYDFLIGADGVNSIVAKTLFGTSFDKNKIGFALEVEVDRKAVKRDLTVPEVYFDSVNWGYGWVFPKEKTLTVGVGGIHSLNPNMKDAMERFHAEVIGKVPLGKVKGHYIPFGDYRKIPGKRNVLLVGDAAGFVEPISGEGIAYAMESGYLASLAVSESMQSGDHNKVLRLYCKKIRTITRDIRYAKAMRYLIFTKRSYKIFIRVFPSSNSLLHKYLDLMADETTYPDFLRFLIRKTVGRGLSRITGKRRKQKER